MCMKSPNMIEKEAKQKNSYWLLLEKIQAFLWRGITKRENVRFSFSLPRYPKAFLQQNLKQAIVIW